MRILVFTIDFPPNVGGVQTMAYQLCKYFVQAGAAVTVLTQEQIKGAEFDSSQAFQVLRFSARSTESTLGKVGQKVYIVQVLRRAIEVIKPDCILCIQWDPCGYLARLATALNSGPPYFLVAHGMELLQVPRSGPFHWGKKFFRTLTFQGARSIFAVSQFTRDQVLLLGVAPECVSVIPNGVEWIESSSNGNPPPNNKPSKNLLTISRLVPRKGHDTVLLSLPNVILKTPNLSYQIVGSGPERNRLERLTRELDLEKHVKFYGQVTDVEKERLLRECDLFVLPCRATQADFEGFGIALVEAMRYGKAVIAGRSGGVTDIVHDEETGLLVTPDDPEGLGNAIVRLLNNQAMARKLGENGQRFARDRYRWDLIARQYLVEMEGRR